MSRGSGRPTFDVERLASRDDDDRVAGLHRELVTCGSEITDPVARQDQKPRSSRAFSNLGVISTVLTVSDTHTVPSCTVICQAIVRADIAASA